LIIDNVDVILLLILGCSGFIKQNTAPE